MPSNTNMILKTGKSNTSIVICTSTPETQETKIAQSLNDLLRSEGFNVHVAPSQQDLNRLSQSLREISVVIAPPLDLSSVNNYHPAARHFHIDFESILTQIDASAEQFINAIYKLQQEALTQNDRQTLIARVRQNVLTMVDSLANALEARDPYTAGHSLRVAQYALAIAQGYGLNDYELEIIRHGSVLHDIGKIAVRQDLLRKTSRLTSEEFEHIKQHPVIGREILEPFEDFKPMLDMVYYHHERIDGRGYPEGLKGDQIPFYAQIVAVADTYDAMTSDRSYRKGMQPSQALMILKEVGGSQLNPELISHLNHFLAEHP
jgi:putative nucleotidyltransferase with HDIG domain